MKKLFGACFASLLILGTTLRAQITAEAFPMDPQTGSHNYFGVRITLSQVYNEDITVTGYIYDEGNPNSDHPFSITVTTGNLTAETAANFYETDPTASAAVEVGTIATTYAGVMITYDASNNILNFNSTTDVNTVLDQLDNDYENHNSSYESQYPNLTADQLDDMDAQTGFDYLKTYRDFENLFTGYISKRSEIESTEVAWLGNNFGGTSPDDIDLTFDDPINTIFNSSYSFKVGNDLYHLASDGFYLNGVYQDGGGGTVASIAPSYIQEIKVGINDNNFVSGPATSYYNGFDMSLSTENHINISSGFMSVCKTNKKKPYIYDPTSTKRFVTKIAIHSIGVSSSIKTKVVYFKKKNNGNWKRNRTDLSVGVAGDVLSTVCNYIDTKSKTDPTTVGTYKKRNELRIRVGDCCTIWKADNGGITGTFGTSTGSGGYSGVYQLTW